MTDPVHTLRRDAALVTKWHKDKDIIARDTLLAHYRGLVTARAVKFNKLYPDDLQDYIQEGYAIVLQCINNYDTTSPVGFAYYLSTVLHFCLLKYKNRNKFMGISLHSAKDHRDYYQIDIEDLQEDHTSDIVLSATERQEVVERIHELVNTCDNKVSETVRYILTDDWQEKRDYLKTIDLSSSAMYDRCRHLRRKFSFLQS